MNGFPALLQWGHILLWLKKLESKLEMTLEVQCHQKNSPALLPQMAFCFHWWLCRHGVIFLEKELLGRGWELMERGERGSALPAAPHSSIGVNPGVKPHLSSQPSRGHVATPSGSIPPLFASFPLCFNCSRFYITFGRKVCSCLPKLLYSPSALLRCREKEKEHPSTSCEEAGLWNVFC